jgi:hypothetical protein
MDRFITNYNPRYRNLRGMRFGRLVAIEPTDRRDPQGCVIWHCKCDCGNETNVSSHSLLRGNTKSCGCGEYDNRVAIPKIRNKAIIKDKSRADLYLSSVPHKDNVLGLRGISQRPSGRYAARLSFSGKTTTIGTFDTLEEAARARRAEEKRVYDPYLIKQGKPPTSDDEFEQALKAALALDKKRREEENA